jgi:lipopolysaccharide transport protein LptA
MGSLSRRNSRTVLLLAMLGAAGSGGVAHAQEGVSLDKCNEQVEIESENKAVLSLRGEGRAQLGKVHIFGCGADIRAGNASTNRMDVEDSTWTFDKGVEIKIGGGQGTLQSDKAVVTFRDSQIQQAVITGSPAQFEHTRGGVTTKGRAGRIVYEFASQKVSLTEDAFVSDGGRTNVNAANLVYNLRTQDLELDGKGSGKGFSLKIDPRLARKKKEDEKKTDEKPPATQNAPENTGTPRAQ